MERGRLFTAWLWIAWQGLILLGIAGQTPPESGQRTLPPGVEVRIEAMPKTATVGDPIRIELDITMPAGYRAKIPKIGTQVGDFAILDFSPGPAVPETGMPEKAAQPLPTPSGTVQHHRARIITAVYRTGKFVFPSIQIGLKTDEGKEAAVASPPVNIEIQSVLTDKDRALKDLKRQADIPEPARWALWLILALAGLILGAAAWCYWKRRRRNLVSLSPAEMRDLLDVAEADLRDLLARGLPASGMEKHFYVLLSEIVKRILQPGYEIHTAERTTSEIVDSLRSKLSGEPKDMELIESFLLRCDVVKFAKYIPSKAEQEAATQDALQILAEARKAVDSRQSPVGSGLSTGEIGQ